MSDNPRGQGRVRIGLLEYFGTGNLGDDATVDAVRLQIERRWPDALIIGLSVNPGDSAARHGISAYPIRQDVINNEPIKLPPPDKTLEKETFTNQLRALVRNRRTLYSMLRAINILRQKIKWLVREIFFLGKAFRVAHSLDLLIICGGGQLLDSWGGPWEFPYTLAKWVVLSRASGARCFYLNVGAGPLDHRLSKALARNSLRLADYVSFRDAKSKELIQSIGFTKSAPVYSDSVYAMDIAHRNTRVSRVREIANDHHWTISYGVLRSPVLL